MDFQILPAGFRGPTDPTYLLKPHDYLGVKYDIDISNGSLDIFLSKIRPWPKVTQGQRSRLLWTRRGGLLFVPNM